MICIYHVIYPYKTIYKLASVITDDFSVCLYQIFNLDLFSELQTLYFNCLLGISRWISLNLQLKIFKVELMLPTDFFSKTLLLVGD